MDADCKNAKCPVDRAVKRFTDAGRLRLDVNNFGPRLWRKKYRFAGKEKALALGRYPAVSSAAARKTYEEARMKLDQLVGPCASRRAAKQAELAEVFRIGEFWVEGSH